MEFKLSKRLGHFEEYFFEKANRKIKEYEDRTGQKVINLGIGSPDLPPTEEIINRLVQEAGKPSNHKYPTYTGVKELREAIAHYYENYFDVDLDIDSEILPLIGSKEGVANIHFAVVDEGDEVLVPDPGYSVYTTGPLMAGGIPIKYTLSEEKNFLPDLDELERLITKDTKMIWINYPNNPTGAVASKADFEELVEFAIKHNIIVAHDNPYANITFDGYKAPSILEVKNAKKVAIEFNSLSKTYNMAGWRIGMAVGNKDIIAALLKIKSNIDTGIFLPLQYAAIEALTGDQKWIIERNHIYQKRRDAVLKMLEGSIFRPILPKAGLYIWAHTILNSKIDNFEVPNDTETLCFDILEKTGVFLTPGTVFGQSDIGNVNGFIRVSICQPIENINEASKRLRKYWN